MRNALKVFVVFVYLISIAKAVELVKLDVPNFSEEQIVNKKIGMRMHGTITIKSSVHYSEETPIIVVDNYGFGENNWTYAPGSVELALEQMVKGYQFVRKQIIPQNETIVILGGGVNSLMLANRLAKEGYLVSIYAEAFSPNITSDVKIGVFIPYMDQGTKRNNIRERIEEYSYLAYAKWADGMIDKEPSIVRPIDLYVVNDNGAVEIPRRDTVIPIPSIVEIEMGYKQRVAALKYKSFAIDTGSVMKDMMEEAKQLGVKFITMKINSLKECKELGATVIFNCIGLGFTEKKSKEEPLISHTMSIKGGERLDYAIYVKHLDGSYTYLFPWNNNSIRITGTFFSATEKRSEAENMKCLITRANSILKRVE